MRSDLLLYLADEAERQEFKFDLGDWARQDECGTAYCMMGFAATLPLFQELGLMLSMKPDGVAGLYLKSREQSFDIGGFDATATLFDIPRIHTEWLFAIGAYRFKVTKAEVIARIREYVQTNGRSYASRSFATSL